MRFYYTDTELKGLLKNMVILIDTREQENSHILAYLDKQKVTYESRKLGFGDYSFMLPANEKLGIIRDTYFDNQITIERKASLEELSSNLTQDRQRFESELIRASKAKLLLMIENACYGDIIGHRYQTQYEPKAFIAALKTYEIRYGISINFVAAALSGNFIYYTFLYCLREYLKGGGGDR